MPAVSRQGDSSSGHGCFPPSTALEGAPDVYCNGQPVLRAGDAWAVHSCGSSAHGGQQAEGSGTVFVNGQPLARIGDGISCGGLVAEGSANVFAGG